VRQIAHRIDAGAREIDFADGAEMVRVERAVGRRHPRRLRRDGRQWRVCCRVYGSMSGISNRLPLPREPAGHQTGGSQGRNAEEVAA
jgi:hypothetical protein